VTYEALVENPEAQLSSLMAFLGVPPVSGLSQVALLATHDRGPADVKIRETKVVDKERVGRGREIDLGHVAPALLERLSRLLEILGYRHREEPLYGQRAAEWDAAARHFQPSRARR
jgi:hypothetical protein